MRRMKSCLSGFALVWAFCMAWGTGAAVAAPERVVSKTVVVNATRDQTWDVWTTRAGITSFFAPDAKVEARVGGPFQIYMDPDAEPGAKGADDMRFMALQPKAMLSFDWNAPPHMPLVRAQRTFVVVRLEAVTDNTTRVTLTHTGWGEGAEWDLFRASECWARVRLLRMEYHLWKVHSFTELSNTLEALNFSVVKHEPSQQCGLVWCERRLI